MKKAYRVYNGDDFLGEITLGIFENKDVVDIICNKGLGYTYEEVELYTGETLVGDCTVMNVYFENSKGFTDVEVYPHTYINKFEATCDVFVNDDFLNVEVNDLLVNNHDHTLELIKSKINSTVSYVKDLLKNEDLRYDDISTLAEKYYLQLK